MDRSWIDRNVGKGLRQPCEEPLACMSRRQTPKLNHKQTSGQTSKQTNKQANRHKQADKQTDRQTNMQRKCARADAHAHPHPHPPTPTSTSTPTPPPTHSHSHIHTVPPMLFWRGGLVNLPTMFDPETVQGNGSVSGISVTRSRKVFRSALARPHEKCLLSGRL